LKYDPAWTPEEIEEVDHLIHLTEKPENNENEPNMTPEEVEDKCEKMGEDNEEGHVDPR
jgi:hypothetical protein